MDIVVPASLRQTSVKETGKIEGIIVYLKKKDKYISTPSFPKVIVKFTVSMSTEFI